MTVVVPGREPEGELPLFSRKPKPLVVREYKGIGQSATKAFEKDAEKMLKQGYRVTHQLWQRHTMLGVHLGTGTLVVTYERESPSP